MSDITWLPLASLFPHPANPRVKTREDVIEMIVTQLKEQGGFKEAHALFVRPHPGQEIRTGLSVTPEVAAFGVTYQIISGHTRAEAARRAGLLEVPCWVDPWMTDEEANMQLVLSNAQGELSPLEVGMHAWATCPPAAGHKGEGLAEYGRRMGWSGQYIGQLYSAAEVAAAIQERWPDFDMARLLERAKHLNEVSKCPPEIWAMFGRTVIEKDWSKDETTERGKVIREMDKTLIPAERAWLPLERAVVAYLRGDVGTAWMARLMAAVGAVRAWLGQHGTPELAEEFEAWLRDEENGLPSYRWDVRRVGEHLSTLVASRLQVTGWHHGKWQDHYGDIEDGSVSLLLTDPPYGQGYQSNMRQEKWDMLAGDEDPQVAADNVAEMLQMFLPKLAHGAHVLVFCGWRHEPLMREAVVRAGYVVRGSLIWHKKAFGMGDLEGSFAPSHERIIHAVAGPEPGYGVLYSRVADVFDVERAGSSLHPTQKPLPLLRQLIAATTAEGQLVADPFGGVASTCVAAKTARRRWWGCELERHFWETGEKRLLGESEETAPGGEA